MGDRTINEPEDTTGCEHIQNGRVGTGQEGGVVYRTILGPGQEKVGT